MQRPLIKALMAQLAGFILAYTLGRNGILPPLGIFWLAVLQGSLAAITSMLLLSPRWWWPIHALFMPSIVLAIDLNIPTPVYALGFAVLLLTYWSSFRTQVPLFLSNRTTTHRLAAWLPDDKPLDILDIGSGTGSFVARLARLRPDWQITGIETAPAPFALSRWRSRKTPNARLLRGDFWPVSLGRYDVVYAFLSPVPMPALWSKALREMRPGTLLVSNSFAIPGASPETTLHIDDSRQTQLFVYRIPSKVPAK